MSSHRSAAVVVVAVLLANLLGDSVLTSASPQKPIVFGDSSTPPCNCVIQEQCPSFIAQLNQHLFRPQIVIPPLARCGNEDQSNKVCCPDNVPGESITTAPTSRTVELPRTCGYYDLVPDAFILAGRNAPLGRHPWMVALGYRSTSSDGSSSAVSFKCGGVLVTTRHVITAANCVDPKVLRRAPLVQLNVGDWNMDTDPDCLSGLPSGMRVCVPPVVVRRPSRITVHPDYNNNGRHNNDIAIVQLEQAVPLEPFIQPICIPESFDPNKHPEPVAIGWGRDAVGTPSTILQEVRLPFVDIEVCNASFNGLLSSGQVCAGGETHRDTCEGDSGSPLVAFANYGPPFKVIGLTSFGRTECGSNHEDNYGVYTSVPYFRDWILASLTV